MQIEPLSNDEIDKLADEIAVSAATVDATLHTLLTGIRRFDELRGWARQGAKSCAHWLSWRIGDGMVAAREKVRVARALGSLPLVDEALRHGKVSYAKVRAIVRVARPETESLLLHYAVYATGAQLETICRGYRQVERTCESGRKSVVDDTERFVRQRRLPSGMVRFEVQLTADEADLVFRAINEARSGIARRQSGDAPDPSLADGVVVMAESLLATGPRARSGGARNQIFVHLSKNDSAESWRAQLADGSWLSGDALLRLACDAGIVMAKVGANGEVLDVGHKLRTVSPALLRALQIRDGVCRFPGCTHRAFVEAHHLEHWAHGGKTNLANLVLLCDQHHHAVHEGGFRVDRTNDGGFIFLDPRGCEISSVPSPGNPLPTQGLGIDRSTNLPHWHGGRVDYSCAVDGLVRRAGIAQHP